MILEDSVFTYLIKLWLCYMISMSRQIVYIDGEDSSWPIVDETCIMSKPYGRVDYEPLFNIAPPLPLEPENTEADTSILWKHLKNLCGKVSQDMAEWVYDWLAYIWQNPDKKTKTALILGQNKGQAKGLFGIN